MNLTGTQIAAGVAQTALQAQQVARQRDRRARAIADTRRIPELIEARLRALEEGDQPDSTTSPHIDEHLPEHQAPPADALNHHRRPYHAPDAEANPASPLYKHLDVQA